MDRYKKWLKLAWPDSELDQGPFFEDLAKDLNWPGKVYAKPGMPVDLLRALDINPGDYVILPTLSPSYWGEAVKAVGADALLIDADPETWQMALDLLEEFLMFSSLLNERDELVLKKDSRVIKAIIVPHLLGNMCDLDRLQFIARRFYLRIAEDITQALGSSWDGRPAGSFGAINFCGFEENPILPFGESVIFSGEQATIDRLSSNKNTPIATLANHIGRQLVNKLREIIGENLSLEKQLREDLKDESIEWMTVNEKCKTNGLSGAFINSDPTFKKEEMEKVVQPLNQQPPFDQWLYLRREDWAAKLFEGASVCALK